MAAPDPTVARGPGTAAARPPYLFRHGAWRSLVARLLWEQEVAGSNPAAPMTAKRDAKGNLRTEREARSASLFQVSVPYGPRTALRARDEGMEDPVVAPRSTEMS